VLLKEIQQILELPEEAILNLSTDSFSRMYLKLFKENIDQSEQEKDALRKLNIDMLAEKNKLGIEVERLTAEKVHFEIRVSMFNTFKKCHRISSDPYLECLAHVPVTLPRSG